MGPFDQAIAWNSQGLKGVFRFLNKTWDLLVENKDNKNSSALVISETEKLIKKVTEDIEKMKFNTCTAFFMEYINFVFEQKEDFGLEAIKKFILIFSPFAPHFCEEIWKLLGNQSSLALSSWPEVNESLIIKDKIILVVQVNGKVRDKIEINGGILKDQALEICLQSEKVKQWLQAKKIKEVVYIPDKIINIVV